MDLDLLRRTALFASFDDAELLRVAEVCRELHFQPSDAIYREGEPGDRLFVIVSGSVRISRYVNGAGEEALAVLGPAASFGEVSVFDGAARSTDAWANEATALAAVARADLERLLDRDPVLARKLLSSLVRLLCGRLRSSNDSLRAFLAMSTF